GAGFSGTVFLAANRDTGNTDTMKMLTGSSIITSNATANAVLIEGYNVTGTGAGGVTLSSITVGDGGTITATAVPADQPTSKGFVLALNPSELLNAGPTGHVVLISAPQNTASNSIGTSGAPIQVIAGTVTATTTASTNTNGGIYVTGEGPTSFSATVA